MTAICPRCRQLVALDAAGIRPHVRHGSPCEGGRAAPTLPEPSERPRRYTAGTVGEARRKAKMRAACDRRNAMVRPHLPAPTVGIARATGLELDAVRVICRRIGAALDESTPRVWRMQ